MSWMLLAALSIGLNGPGAASLRQTPEGLVEEPAVPVQESREISADDAAQGIRPFAVINARARYVHIGIDNDGPRQVFTYLDRHSIRPGAGTLLAWETIIYNYQAALLPRGTREVKMLAEYDCARRRFSVLQAVNYSATGTVLSSERGPASYFEYVVPDSVGDDIRRFLCNEPPRGPLRGLDDPRVDANARMRPYVR